MKYIAINLAILSLLAASPAAMATNAPEAVAAQQAEITIKGQVFDNEDQPMIGTAVVIMGTNNGVTTDIDGNFSIIAPSNATLEISSVGYQKKTVKVNGRSDLGTIILNPDAQMLGETVVIGYGTQKKVDLTGSVATVDAEQVKKVSNSNISTLLEGKVAGVQITTDGQPGADPLVRIRGIGSFNNTSPLYVIDGVPMGTSIRDFSPNDIETIQVLKDASAAAIYGSRAANGVIIITTKNGQKDQPLRIDYSGYVGIDKIRKNVYKVMDAAQFGDYTRMIYANYGMDAPAGYIFDHKDYIDPKVVNTDWFNEVFKTGIRQNHNLNFSGGGKHNTYNIAVDFYDQKGTLQGAGPNYQRFTVRANNTMEVKFLKIRTSVTYTHSDQDNMAISNANEYVQGLYGTSDPIMKVALTMPPTIKAYDPTTWCLDDKISAASKYSYDSYGYGTYYDTIHGDIRVTNPLLTNNLLTRNEKVDRVVLTGALDLDIFKMVKFENKNHKLDYNLNLAWSRTFVQGKTFIPSYIQSTTNYLAKENETLTKYQNNYSDFLVENYITYDGNIEGHHINAVAGITFEREAYNNLNGTGINLPEPYYLQLGNAANRNSSSYEDEHTLSSFIGRLNYDYKGRYLLSVTARRDGSSRLSKDGRWEWFPSFSAGWRLDQEEWIGLNPQKINLLKIRGSYGILGNENIGNYQYMALMERGNYTYSFNNVKVTGSAISNYVNTAIRWEKKKTLDVGADLAMFNNMIEINVDYYRATSEDLLYAVAVPAEAGATNSTVTMNAATMRNQGFELSATYRNYNNPLKFSITANVSYNQNKVLSLGTGKNLQDDGDFRTEVGAEVGRFYGYRSDGIFRSADEIDNNVNAQGQHVVQNGAQPGDVRYVDLNNDGLITSADREYLGSGMPKVNFGLSFGLEYKGFDLNVSTYGAGGFKVLDDIYRTLHSSYGTGNRSVDMLNAWTPENPNSNVPRASYKAEGDVTNDMFSQRFLQNGAYWKIANVELGYNLKDKWFKGIITGARVYVSGQNLATISGYKGYNIDFAGGTFTPGYNYCSYPTPITFMAGLHFSF